MLIPAPLQHLVDFRRHNVTYCTQPFNHDMKDCPWRDVQYSFVQSDIDRKTPADARDREHHSVDYLELEAD